MKLRRCPNGHFYQDDGTGRCQLCQQLADPPTEAQYQPPTPAPDPPFVGGGVLDAPPAPPTETKGDDSRVPNPPFVGGGVLDAPLMQQPSSFQAPTTPAAPAPPFVGGGVLDAPLHFTATPPQPAATPLPTTPAAVPAPPAAPVQPPPPPPLDDAHTVAVFETPVGINPVVGWLVSRKGSYFGQGFELHSGQNSVGRSLDMDVPLPQDAAIERIRHCMVIFEPQRQDFFLQVEGRSGPVYLNDERVTQNRLLQKRDVIRLGGSELVFFPLCCEAFSWQEVLTT